MSLPAFKYHPNPIATGSVVASPAECRCCGRARGYIYSASVYAVDSLRDQICPWCIADGSAAQRFDAMFSDDDPLVRAQVPADVVEEVTRRTPGYVSWQQEHWLSCCRDACEFHGDATRAQLTAATGPAIDSILSETRMTPQEWLDFLARYEPGGSPAIYHFVCRHCKHSKFGWDCD